MIDWLSYLSEDEQMLLTRTKIMLHAAGSHPLLLVEIDRLLFSDIFQQPLVDMAKRLAEARRKFNIDHEGKKR